MGTLSNYFKDNMGTDLISSENPLPRSPEGSFVLAVKFYNASVVNFTVSSSIIFRSHVNKYCCSTILSCQIKSHNTALYGLLALLSSFLRAFFTLHKS